MILDFENQRYAVKETRTNFCANGTAWTGTAMTVTPGTGDTTDPFGGNNAVKIQADGTAGGHFAYLNSITYLDGIYTISAYVKTGTGNQFVQIFPTSQAGPSTIYANFDIVNGTVQSLGAGATSSGMTSVGDGWYRIWCSFTTTPTGGSGACVVVGCVNSGSAARGGGYVTSEVFYALGLQCEFSHAPTAYIPTTTTSVSAAGSLVSHPLSDIFTYTSTTAEQYFNAAGLYAWCDMNLIPLSEDMTNGSGGWVYTNGGTGTLPVKVSTSSDVPNTSYTQSVRFTLNKGAGTATTDLSEVYGSGLPTADPLAQRGLWAKSADGNTYTVIIGGGNPVTVTSSWQYFTRPAGAERFRIMIRGAQTPTCSDSADILVTGAKGWLAGYYATGTEPAYTRTTGGSAYYGPCFAFDPETGANLGLQIQENRTNIVKYSQSIYGNWSENGSTTSSVAGVLGFASGSSVASNGFAWHRYHQTLTAGLTGGTTYAWSVIAKAGTSGLIAIRFRDQALALESYCYGTVGSTLTTSTGAGAFTHDGSVHLGGGVYFIHGTFIPTNTVTAANIYFGVGPYSVNTGETVIFYAAQVEQAGYATLPIYTTTASVTRSADVVLSDATNISPFPNWFSATAGATNIKVNQWLASAYSTRLFNAPNAGNTESISLVINSTQTQIFRMVGGVVEYGPNRSRTFTPKSDVKYGAIWANNDFNVLHDGSTITNDPTAPIPSNLVKAYLGSNTGIAPLLNGYMKQFVYYDFRVTDSEMIRVTT